MWQKVILLLGTSSSFGLSWLESFLSADLPHSVSRSLFSMFVCVALKRISCLHLDVIRTALLVGVYNSFTISEQQWQ